MSSGPKRIALIGDFDAAIVAHRAIPLALEMAVRVEKVEVEWEWVGSEAAQELAKRSPQVDAVWVVPGSPYRDMHGVLNTIRFARVGRRPFLGTCGGFQHALIEYARNVAGIATADHAESNPEAREQIVTALSCSLVEKKGGITFAEGSAMQRIFEGRDSEEGYHCNFGLNPVYREKLEKAGLRFTAFDTEGAVRGFELPGHPFFFGTLFQPERSALEGRGHPLVRAFVKAVSKA